MSQRTKTMSKLLSALAAGGLLAAVAVVGVLILSTTAPPVKAWFSSVPCDFLTGGGWILPPAGSSNGVKANFAIGGGCKNGSTPGPPPIPYWGHLNYLDHGTSIKPPTAPTPFHVHWTSIDAYVFVCNGINTDGENCTGPSTDTKTGQPVGTREVCGTAETNDPVHPTVHFRVRAADNGEPGTNDFYWMHLSDPGGSVFYDTGCTFLGSSTPCGSGTGGPGGGNIQLHKHNPSNTGTMLTECPYP